jgi:hypothetical protein
MLVARSNKKASKSKRSVNRNQDVIYAYLINKIYNSLSCIAILQSSLCTLTIKDSFEFKFEQHTQVLMCQIASMHPLHVLSFSYSYDINGHNGTMLIAVCLTTFITCMFLPSNITKIYGIK